MFGFLSVFIFGSKSFSAVGEARARWLDSTQIRLKLPPGFYVSANTHFYLNDGSLPLSHDSSLRLPVLKTDSSFAWLDSSRLTKDQIDLLIRKPLKVIATNNNRKILDSTAIQYAGLFDDLYFYSGQDLGGLCVPSACTVKVWTPPAQNVRLLIFKNSDDPIDSAEVQELSRDDSGVWGVHLSPSYKNSFYLFEVTVFQPQTDKVEVYRVTDPYSRSLTLNGEKSQLVQLDSSETTPSSWASIRKPVLRSLKDSVIYELHIRDFSASDRSVPESKRGTYLAFTEKNSASSKHLQDLASAGLTHLHLLPFNDFGTVNEFKNQWETYTGPSSNLQEPQSVIGGMRLTDPYNWGYDPVHFMTPEGSYAVQGDGASRIYEVRQMVQAINAMGLRVVQDVVLNHSYQSGAERFSVFDKIVPLYYYRLDDQGVGATSSCCWDTASEHRMMEKLMIDSVVYWAKTYKLDGFRFDLMSFHSVQTMSRIRQALLSLTPAKDGVDGSKILLYGEGWSFGSFFERHPRDAMTLENSGGTQYGFFNDRLRDAVRGGSTSSSGKADQGFATGLYFDFNFDPASTGTPPFVPDQRGLLLHYGDVIKVGLAGNVKDFFFREHLGNVIRAGDLRFRGATVAYAQEALETINYVSAHDGYGLWDAVQAKAAFSVPGRTPSRASSEERQRMHQLALAIPLLGQGVPFVESGTELLRSKNGDQDSYDSGDFFNRIDWTGTTNYWGSGLPPAWKNINDWPFWQPRLLSPEMQVTTAQISRTKEYFKALLRLRQSSDLFKMNLPTEISQKLKFIDNDRQAEPGLIAMHLENSNEEILVLFNASREPRSFTHDILKSKWQLHPLFDQKIDSVLASVSFQPDLSRIQIPGRTTVVLQPTDKRDRR